MGVKRFDLIESIGGEAWMEEAALGEYVKASDYDRLQEVLALMTKDRNTLLEITGTTIKQVAARIDSARTSAGKSE